MTKNEIKLVSDINQEFYDHHFSEEELLHRYPNVNTVRCEIWYFRKHGIPGRLLDYGFGYGREAIYFAEKGYDVHGIDISEGAKKSLESILKKEKPKLKGSIKTIIIKPSDNKLPYENNYFDFIHSNQTIYHLPNKQAIKVLINEWARILKPGGKVVFSTVGTENSCIVGGKEIEKGLFEKEYKTPGMKKPMKLRSYLMKDENEIKSICCPPFEIDEIGWFTNHYCGLDGFHWQVFLRKPEALNY